MNNEKQLHQEAADSTNLLYSTIQLKRIADALDKTTNYRTGEVTELRGIRNALEEILRLVKKDMEPREKN